jgi:hypothetical protein
MSTSPTLWCTTYDQSGTTISPLRLNPTNMVDIDGVGQGVTLVPILSAYVTNSFDINGDGKNICFIPQGTPYHVIIVTTATLNWSDITLTAGQTFSKLCMDSNYIYTYCSSLGTVRKYNRSNGTFLGTFYTVPSGFIERMHVNNGWIYALAENNTMYVCDISGNNQSSFNFTGLTFSITYSFIFDLKNIYVSCITSDGHARILKYAFNSNTRTVGSLEVDHDFGSSANIFWNGLGVDNSYLYGFTYATTTGPGGEPTKSFVKFNKSDLSYSGIYSQSWDGGGSPDTTTGSCIMSDFTLTNIGSFNGCTYQNTTEVDALLVNSTFGEFNGLE